MSRTLPHTCTLPQGACVPKSDMSSSSIGLPFFRERTKWNQTISRMKQITQRRNSNSPQNSKRSEMLYQINTICIALSRSHPRPASSSHGLHTPSFRTNSFGIPTQNGLGSGIDFPFSSTHDHGMQCNKNKPPKVSSLHFRFISHPYRPNKGSGYSNLQITRIGDSGALST